MPNSETSDDSAVEKLRGMVEASGGSRAWIGISSAELRYRVTGRAGVQRERLMLDDWSSDRVRYRRALVGMKGRPMDHDGKALLVVQRAKDGRKEIDIPEFDQARVLVDHLPAPAAQVILRNPAYIVKTGTYCAAEKICLNIYRRPEPQAPFRDEQQWILDASTHLPERIMVLLPSVLRPQDQIWKTVFFGGYRSEEGVMLPHSISAGLPGGGTHGQELIAVKFSCGFDVNAFDREVNQ